jgi:hypothetical protein
VDKLNFKVAAGTLIADSFGQISLATTSSGDHVQFPWFVFWENVLGTLDIIKCQIPVLLLYMIDTKLYMKSWVKRPEMSQQLANVPILVQQMEDSIWMLITAIYKHVLSNDSKEILDLFKIHVPALLKRDTTESHSILEVCIKSFGLDFLGGLDQIPSNLNYQSFPGFPKALEQYFSKESMSNLEPDCLEKVVNVLRDNPLKGPETEVILANIRTSLLKHDNLVVRLEALAQSRLSKPNPNDDPVALHVKAGKEFEEFLELNSNNLLEYQIRLESLSFHSQYHVNDRLSSLWLASEQMTVPPIHKFNLQPSTTISGLSLDPKSAPPSGEILAKHPIIDMVALKSNSLP